MTTFYAISIDAGVLSIRYTGSTMHNTPEAYFSDFLGVACPAPMRVAGWPFAEIYIANGNAENGVAVAWA
jgi:hypothetical protein